PPFKNCCVSCLFCEVYKVRAWLADPSVVGSAQAGLFTTNHVSSTLVSGVKLKCFTPNSQPRNLSASRVASYFVATPTMMYLQFGDDGIENSLIQQPQNAMGTVQQSVVTSNDGRRKRF